MRAADKLPLEERHLVRDSAVGGWALKGLGRPKGLLLAHRHLAPADLASSPWTFKVRPTASDLSASARTALWRSGRLASGSGPPAVSTGASARSGLACGATTHRHQLLPTSQLGSILRCSVLSARASTILTRGFRIICPRHHFRPLGSTFPPGLRPYLLVKSRTVRHLIVIHGKYAQNPFDV